MLKFSIVDSNHLICSSDYYRNLNKYMENFWCSRELSASDHAVLVHDNNELVGFFRFDLQNNTLFGAGTYVSSKYRNKGIASKMWEMALDSKNPAIVEVYLTSYGAVKLMNSITSSLKYKNIDFCCFRA